MEIPSWQPDSAVDSCFICTSQYNFLNRRHHCRKCGRVVCASCSGQKIRYLLKSYVINAHGPALRSLHKRTYRTCDECVAEIRIIGNSLSHSPFLDDSSCNLPAPVLGGLVRSSTCGNSPSLHKKNTKHGAKNATRALDSSSAAQTLANRTDSESDHNLCPVCAVDLLQLFAASVQSNGAVSSLNAFEAFKEAHVNECLASFDFTNDRMRLQSPPSGFQARNRMLVYNIPPIPKPIYVVLDQAGLNSVETISPNKEISGLLVSTTSMVGEKDVLDKECVICLEDLKQGDKVGRLECLCIFHYKCIKDWFNKKTYGECPIHFLHK